MTCMICEGLRAACQAALACRGGQVERILGHALPESKAFTIATDAQREERCAEVAGDVDDVIVHFRPITMLPIKRHAARRN